MKQLTENEKAETTENEKAEKAKKAFKDSQDGGITDSGSKDSVDASTNNGDRFRNGATMLRCF